MRILIVDDEILVRIGIKSCAEWDKYGMETVSYTHLTLPTTERV